MTKAELEQVRDQARLLLERLKVDYPGCQVTLTEWMAHGGIAVSVVWPFKREEVQE